MSITDLTGASTVAVILAADHLARATPEGVAGACDASSMKTLPQDRP
ncbi:MAG: hypothetical protein ABIQ70_00710 [Dokdonella sp.]